MNRHLGPWVGRALVVLVGALTVCAVATGAAVTMAVANDDDAPTAGVRPPAAAGRFYPEDANQLHRAIQGFLQDARPTEGERPLAILVPHAGYPYSGQIAADAYARARCYHYDLVVILGTNHTSAGFRGVSIWPDGGYRTPLGVARIDDEVASALLVRDESFTFDRDVHSREHSVEVQVPFVQECFPDVPIVAAVVGRPDPALCERFGRALAEVLQGRKALIVASSDLSHYPAYQDAVKADHKTLAAVAQLDPELFRTVVGKQERAEIPHLSTCACGQAPILAMITAARALGATRAEVLSYANSGDSVLGDHDQVVGYGAVVMTAGDALSDTEALDEDARNDMDCEGEGPASTKDAIELSTPQKQWLLAFARETLRRYFNTGVTPLPRHLPVGLRRCQGAFVTLEKHGRLRGCIGHIEADRPLAQTVGQMALHAALADPRFPPLQPAELSEVEIEISVLTVPRPAAADAIVVGRDGVILHRDDHSAVFLPQVAPEQGWDRTQLLDQLCHKAGLGSGCWREHAELEIFQAVVFHDTPVP
jgi:AmmeMemoRadiSam system protein B/AmmeMemoRadiSam system protein A